MILVSGNVLQLQQETHIKTFCLRERYRKLKNRTPGVQGVSSFLKLSYFILSALFFYSRWRALVGAHDGNL